MVAVDEIDVGVTGRAEKYGIAQGSTCGGVSSRIVDAEVGFDLDDTSGQLRVAGISDEDLAQELAGYAARIADEKSAIKGMDLASFQEVRAYHAGEW